MRKEISMLTPLILVAVLLVGCGGGTNTTPQTTCASFTYAAWGACSNGLQSRTILTSSPTSCTGGSPVVSQSCGVDPIGQVPYSAVFLDFENPDGELHSGFGRWHYDSPELTPSINSINYAAGGFYSDPDSHGLSRTFYPYYNGYNTSHMGWTRWGYADIQAGGRVAGGANSMKFTFTGGAYEDGDGVTATYSTSGREVRSREQWRAYGNDPSVLATVPLDGDIQFYVKTGSATNPIDEAQGANRISFWVYLPTTTPAQNPQQNIQWYPFTDDARQSHFYHSVSNIGLGGWTHVMFDAHPHHRNSWSNTSPYFSSCRVGGDATPGDALAYFSRVVSFALRIKGFALNTYPTSIYLDHVKFFRASEPENDETILGMGIGFNPTTREFDISFLDKYKVNERQAVYEVRYAFTPITLASYASAKPVRIIQHPSAAPYTDPRAGHIKKTRSGYNELWALMALEDADAQTLVDGRTVYFAVKDVSTWSSESTRDTYDLEMVTVPGGQQVARNELIKTSFYTIYPAP